MPSTPVRVKVRSLVEGAAQGALLFADVGLSFWGAWTRPAARSSTATIR
ncbi:hypothetical protein PHLH5_28860 [Pseudomonas sp. Cab53]|nr:hypothetical protein PHLH5_28860 [Pseudomonas sp. Cab53]